LPVDGLNYPGKVPGSAILEVVAIYGRDDHMTQSEFVDGCCDASGFVWIESCRAACRDVAKSTGPRADIAHDQKGSVTF